MGITITISEQHAQALGICKQLLDMGNFNLPGKDLEVAVQAKRLLAEVCEKADAAAAPAITPEVVEASA
jgi:hypothetical protein